MGIFSGGEVSRDEFERLLRRVEELEHRVAAQALGGSAVASGSEPMSAVSSGLDLSQVLELKQQGKLINAIKVYREITGAGLKEAKETVERM